RVEQPAQDGDAPERGLRDGGDGARSRGEDEDGGDDAVGVVRDQDAAAGVAGGGGARDLDLAGVDAGDAPEGPDERGAGGGGRRRGGGGGRSGRGLGDEGGGGCHEGEDTPREGARARARSGGGAGAGREVLRQALADVDQVRADLAGQHLLGGAA